MTWLTLEDAPCAHRETPTHACFKQSNADFVVDEVLPFTCDGDGEHRYLRVKKSGCNTLWLRDQMAKFANLPARDVGYAGLKDRHATTYQWFSVPIRQGQPAWSDLPLDGVEIVETHRHRRKLHIGALCGNRFEVILRDIRGPAAVFETLLETIRVAGVPNYFMDQRFGHQMGNLDTALRLFAGEIKIKQKKKRGIYFSAARAYLFNQVLAERVRQRVWNQALPGDVFFLAGTRKVIWDHDDLSTFQTRCAAFDVHPSGPLWGGGPLITSAEVQALEVAALQTYPVFQAGLENVGMKQERRSLRLMVQDLTHTWLDQTTLKLSFMLGRGGYATAVLRELAVIDEGELKGPR